MTRSVKIIIPAVVILVAINLIPFKTGPTVGGYCGMEYEKYTLTVFGVPFGYLQNTTHTGCGFTLLKQGRSVFKTDSNGLDYDNYHFKASAFAGDALIALAILAAIYIANKQLHK